MRISYLAWSFKLLNVKHRDLIAKLSGVAGSSRGVFSNERLVTFAAHVWGVSEAIGRGNVTVDTKAVFDLDILSDLIGAVPLVLARRTASAALVAALRPGVKTAVA